MQKVFLNFFFLFSFISHSYGLENEKPLPETHIESPSLYQNPSRNMPEKSPNQDLQNQNFPFPPEELIGKPDEQTDKFLVEFMKMSGTLGLIIAIILLLAWVLKRFTNARLEQMNSASQIRIMERRSLSPKTVLYLLEVNHKIVLVGESQNGVTRLAEFESPSDEVKAEAATPSAFSQLLDNKNSNHKNN